MTYCTVLVYTVTVLSLSDWVNARISSVVRNRDRATCLGPVETQLIKLAISLAAFKRTEHSSKKKAKEKGDGSERRDDRSGRDGRMPDTHKREEQAEAKRGAKKRSREQW